jgi:D-threo-aldose 1-dehydrogenase
MLPTRELPGTPVVTTAVGFGCAGLFRLPQRSARRSVLDAAWAAGIRHFDTAPMYGLGLSEAELGAFLKGRRADATVTTKFGIEPTLLARGVGLCQAPVRALLARRPSVGEGLKTAAAGPGSGAVGRLLYAAPGYHRRSAQAGLERSLRTLRTDYIDVFLLHDPVGGLISGAPELADYLNEQQRLGRIRCWGVTGQPSALAGPVERLGGTPVAQFQDDIFEDAPSAPHTPGGAWITFGALARAVPAVRRFLAQSPGAAGTWSERLGADLAAESTLPRLLLGAALRRNPSGPVLFSTTRPDRVRVAAEAAARAAETAGGGAGALSDLAAAVRPANPERTPAP